MAIFPAQAVDITVNSTADNTTASDSSCTLREAIDNAQNDSDSTSGDCPAGSGSDTIVLTKDTYTINSAFPNISTDITITGNNATLMAGNTGYRFFRIESGSTLTLTNIILDGATQTGSSDGGAIRVNNGTLNATNCAFVNNSTSGGDAHGGAVAVKSSGTANITNCTISGNSANHHGGGILVQGTLTINNSTVTNNTADYNGDNNQNGGGIYNSGTVNIKNTIVAGNTDGSTGTDHPDVSGTFTSSGYNLIGKNDGSTSFTQTGDQVGTIASPLDPLLANLADNGGDTKTHALQTGSPAIDTGNTNNGGATNGACVAIDNSTINTDQRNRFRAQGTNKGDSGCDIGAYEFNSLLPTVTSITRQTPSTSPTNADSLIWRITFSREITDIDTADFTVSGTTATVTDVSSVSSTDIYDVTVSGGDLANLNATVTLSFSGGQNITDVIGNTLTNTTPTDTNDATFVVDNTAPTLAEVTAVTTPTTDSTPDYTFSSDEEGTITYGGDCSSSTTNALNGNNSITFNTLALGTHSNCTITVTNSAGNASNSLAITSFTIAYSVNTVSNTQTIEEDTPLIFSTANSNLISISDIELEDAVGHPVTASLTATNGSLTLNSTTNLTFINGDGTDDASMEFTGIVTDINTALAGMNFTPTSNFNGDASVQIVINDGTLTDDDTINITVTAVNDLPTAADNTVTLNEDEAYTFSEADFEFSDIDTGNSLTQIKIMQLPSVGTLQLDGVDVTIDQVIVAADISKLTFTPAANANGSNYATFQFKVHDGTSYSDAYFTMSIDVTAVNDAPTTADKTVTLNEDEAYTFTEADFEFSDVETGNSLNQIKITQLPTVGTLQLDSVDVTIDQVIVAADIGKLTFTPAANANGNTYATFQFKVHDGTSYSDADFTMTIDVTAVNDAPSFTKGDDQTVFVNAEQNITAWATNIDFGSANESSQTLNFIVTNDNNSLFSVQPAIDTSGNLTFIPSTVGSAVVTVILSDGIDTSAAQSFNIKVDPLPSSSPTQQPTGCTLSSNVNCAIKNEGTITDVKIEPEGSIEGGTLEGEIKNEGTLTDVTLAAGTNIDGGQIQGKVNGNPEAPAILINVKIIAKTELSNVILDKTVELPNDVTLTNIELRGSSVNGGKLEGTIRTTSSATVIQNVSLGENTTIIGGKLAGTISGTPNKPAILEHLTIEPQTLLTDVTISDGVEMPADVNLASGVRFTKTENIPTDVDLTETLPKKGQSVDLSADPVIGGEGILPAINRLSEFVPAELTVLQHDKGFIYLDIEGIRYAVNPIKVKHLSEAERLQLESGQTVRFKTDTQIDVLAPPAIQDISSFKETLIKINLPTVNINNDGNIKVLVTEKVWYSGRPDLASTTVDKDTPNGFITKEDGNVALIFEDEKGEKREQILYPSPANMSALGKFDLTPKGILEFEINGQKFKGRLDYQVKQGIKLETRHALSLTEIPAMEIL
jgi:CSLREA domain-containing protein